MEQAQKKRGRPKQFLTKEMVEERKLVKRLRNNSLRQIQENLNCHSSNIGGSTLGEESNPTLESSPSGSGLGVNNRAEVEIQNHESGLPHHASRPNDSEDELPNTQGTSAIGSHQSGRHIALRRKAFLSTNEVLDMGHQDGTCGFCDARVWLAESTGRHVGNGPKGYSICCGKGKVLLPLLYQTPQELLNLLTSTSEMGKEFFSKSRVYNTIFAFCSFGGRVDTSVNMGKGPFVFRVSGQIHHNLGSLIPPDGRSPKFAQLYMYDAQEALQHRINFTGNEDDIDPVIVELLQNMLNRDNALAGIFKNARERFHAANHIPIRLRIFERRTTDGRFENRPTDNDYEFAGLIVDNDLANGRDIVVEDKRLGLKHIDNLHPCFMSLQYPLLFPHGEDGYRINIKHRNASNTEVRRMSTVSQREYYAFRLQYRLHEGHTLLLGGRLLLQFIVDAWCSIERARLQWVQTHQSTIRSDLYNNVVDSFRRGDSIASELGKRVVLPSSFTGGYRYMQQNYQDSLAVCKEYGHPDLFITFTCNPKWNEIQRAVEASGSRDASVRPDIVARVFKLKLDALMDDLTKNNVLGRALAVVYTVEFQKRGLPHAHIVLWLADGDKILTPDDIDEMICAEIPDKETDLIGYTAVSQLMIHGPCGAADPKCPCMIRGKCSKYFPKAFNSKTTLDADGYALYRRRDMGRVVERKNIILDNRHVVPYHRGLLVKYQGHINVEWCNRALAIKYLFKYIGKGPDTATFVLEKQDQQSINGDQATTSLKKSEHDEVKSYVSARYISAAEACWRIFEFPIHHREPYVQRLYFHLENEQEVRFRDDESVPEVVRRTDPDGTMFVQWLLSNRCDALGRDLTFVQYPTKFRWDTTAKRWFRRKKNISVIGRMVYAHPASGERFYLRLLLNIVTGSTSFEDIRSVDGVVYPTYKEACFHRGLLDSDKEWHVALEAASLYATAPQLRDLFVTLLVFCEVSNPLQLWEKHWASLADDIEYTQRKITNCRSLKISSTDKQMLALEAIDNLLKQYGKKLNDYPGMPEFSTAQNSRYKNELMVEEMMYDREELRAKASFNFERLNQVQRIIFETILQAVETTNGGLYFVYGPGGTGKTFLWSTIISKLRSEGKIVLAVASSGIASLLMEGGRTAHSRFKIPIEIDEFTCCNIKQNTYLAELICATDLVIWDEAPMNHRFIFEAVDRTFRDIRTKVNPDAQTLPFGGLTVLLGGDFRQILPVIPKKGRAEIVASSITKSHLWNFCKVFQLTENMRIEKNVQPVTIDGRTVPFRDWILSLGDGSEPSYALADDLEPSWIKIPQELQVPQGANSLEAIINEIYGDVHRMNSDDIDYLRNRAILTPLNEFVDSVNNHVLERLVGDFKVCKSSDSICAASSQGPGDDVLYPPEFLNSLKFSGVPNHEIRLKVGAPIMLLRNLNPKRGLCNGTRLIVTRCYPFLIEALIITGNKHGETTYIPRISMSPADKSFPVLLKRKQFPIAVSYAMTINKSQGQTVKNVGLYLPKPVFSHGHLYVAVSRVTSPAGLKILCVDEDPACAGYTKNIVYHEIFDSIL